MSKISIIVTVLNCAASLHKCIDSILGQSYKDLELILIDSGSTDKSLDICERYAKYDYRIKLISLENTSQNAARNTGLTLATGDYLMFVNSDDFLIDNTIEQCLAITQKTSSDIVIFEWYEQTLQGIKPASLPCKIRNNHDALVSDIICNRQPAYLWNKFYSRDIWNNMEFNSSSDIVDTSIVKELFTKATHIFYFPHALYVHNCSKPKFAPNLKAKRSNLSPKTNLLTAALLQLKALLN